MKNTMKHAILIIAGILIFNIAKAQDEKFEIKGAVGVSTMINYPAISIFQDNTASYSSGSQALQFAYRWNSTWIGLHYQTASFSTFAVDLTEATRMHLVALSLRMNQKFGGHFEVAAGIKGGLSIAQCHNFQTRLGGYAEFDLGVNYHFSHGFFVGVNAAFFYGSHSDNNFDVPAGYTQNYHIDYGGYSIMLNYGVRF